MPELPQLNSQSHSAWTLAQWLCFLENQRPNQKTPTSSQVIKQVAASLNLLVTEAIVILVAGTNGKGTTVAALEAIYREAGYRVGSYTSPHLLAYNERIKVNGACIEDALVCQAFCQIETINQKHELTYFQMTTLAALIHFQNCQVQVIILEAGIGGRFDATNIIEPDLSIITTIDFDHQAMLGNTLDKIGFEKAGILRFGKPFIYADAMPPPIIERCASLLQCPTYINGKQFNIQLDDERFTFGFHSQQLQFPKLHWHPNAIAAALMASIVLQEKLPLPTEARLQGLLSIKLAGRQQYFKTGEGPVTLIDVSHNAQSVAYLAKIVVDGKSKTYNKIHAVFSALGDKDIDTLIEPMVPCVEQWYPTLLAGKRAASAEQLQSIFRKYGIIEQEFYKSPLDAYWIACQKASPNDLIVVYGSFLTVGEVLAALNREFSRSKHEGSHRGKSEA